MRHMLYGHYEKYKISKSNKFKQLILLKFKHKGEPKMKLTKRF